jgi:hypothetical protein
MSDQWGKSFTVPASAFDLTPEQQAKHDEMLDAMAKMGRSSHFYVRKVARDAGMTTLPGSVIYVGPRGGPMEAITRSEEDLSIMLEGEAEWLTERSGTPRESGEP